MIAGMIVVLGALSIFSAFANANIQSVDGASTAPAFKAAEPIQRPPPEYPSRAFRNNYEGWVTFSYSVDEEGKVSDIEAIDGSGVGSFISAGKKALRRWAFKPATLNGQPIKSSGLEVRLDWKLEIYTPDSYQVQTYLEELADARAAVDEGKLRRARKLIDDVDSQGDNVLANAAAFSLLMADYAKEYGDIEAEASSFGRTFAWLTDRNQPKSVRNAAYIRMLDLMLKTRRYQSAFKLFDIMQVNVDNSEVLAEATAKLEKAQLVLANGKSFKVNGRIHKNFFWEHTLLYNQFAIIDIDGDVDQMQLRCDLGMTEIEFKEFTTYTTPGNWGVCKILVEGDSDTTFTIIESKP